MRERKITKRMVAITVILAFLFTTLMPLGIVPSKVQATSDFANYIFDMSEGFLFITDGTQPRNDKSK